MIKVKELGIEEAYSKIMNLCDVDHYQYPQIEILDKNKMSDFLIFLNSIECYSRVDELGGRSDVRRYSIDKRLNDILHQAHASIACGIQIIKYPLFKIKEHELWEGGYIEGFARMDADKKSLEWFYWSYIRMTHLQEILKKFEEDLFIF